MPASRRCNRLLLSCLPSRTHRVAFPMCEPELRRLLAAGKTFVVGMSHCPYTTRAVAALSADTPRFMLDEYDDSSRVLDWLAAEYGHHTVPLIFVDGEFVGGSEYVSTPDALRRL